MTYPRLIIDSNDEDRLLFEAASKGYLKGAFVELAEGIRHPVFFYDPVRLAQDLDSEIQLGRPYLAEKGMIVLREITSKAMMKAVTDLFHSGFFGNPTSGHQ